MSYVKHGIAVMRLCLRPLVTLDDIHGLQESIEREIRHTMLVKEEYARLMGRAKRMDQKDNILQKTGAWFEQLKTSSPCFRCRYENRYWNILGSACGQCYLMCTDCSHMSLYTTSILVYQNCLRRPQLRTYHLTELWPTWDTSQTSRIHRYKNKSLCFAGGIPVLQPLKKVTKAANWGLIFVVVICRLSWMYCSLVIVMVLQDF